MTNSNTNQRENSNKSPIYQKITSVSHVQSKEKLSQDYSLKKLFNNSPSAALKNQNLLHQKLKTVKQSAPRLQHNMFACDQSKTEVSVTAMSDIGKVQQSVSPQNVTDLLTRIDSRTNNSKSKISCHIQFDSQMKNNNQNSRSNSLTAQSMVSLVTRDKSLRKDAIQRATAMIAAFAANSSQSADYFQTEKIRICEENQAAENTDDEVVTMLDQPDCNQAVCMLDQLGLCK